MPNPSRRTLLAALGSFLPLGLARTTRAGRSATAAPALLRFRSFEQAVRDAFANDSDRNEIAVVEGRAYPCRRIAVGESEIVQAGLQGCTNGRPFAGFPAGGLRVVRTAVGPGPQLGGVRLYVTTLEIAAVDPRHSVDSTRSIEFADLPASPILG